MSNAQLPGENLNSALRSDPLEIGGSIDVEGALLEFNLGDISGTGFDERFCTGVVWKREERVKTGAIEERGNAKSVGVARGDDWFARILPLSNVPFVDDVDDLFYSFGITPFSNLPDELAGDGYACRWRRKSRS
jgi:hypothetical protein